MCFSQDRRNYKNSYFINLFGKGTRIRYPPNRYEGCDWSAFVSVNGAVIKPSFKMKESKRPTFL